MAGIPAHYGFTFVPTSHHSVPEALDPSRQTLPDPFVVCVVGASRGIGAGTAKAFAQAGATGLILTGASESAALRQTKADCEAVAKSPQLKVTILGADVTHPDTGKRLADTIKAEFGRLDILILNAGIVSTDTTAYNRFEEINVEQIRDPLETNYIGRFAIVKQVIPLLLSPDSAKIIINLSSAKQHFASDGALGYNISTLATARLTEALAETYGEQGILASAVHPGIVPTDPPLGMPLEHRAWATDSPGLCGAFLIRLAKEKPMWLNGRYISANWDIDELLSKKEEVVAGDKLKMRMVV